MNEERDWQAASRRRVDEAMRRANYLCPRNKRFVNGLSKEDKEALKEVLNEMEKEYVEGGE